MNRARRISATLAVLAATGTGCGSARQSLPDSYSITLPPVSAPTRCDIVSILKRGEEPPPIDMAAAVFALGDPLPNTGHQSWKDMMAVLRTVREAVVEGGFKLKITGTTESTGSAERNAELSGRRAGSTRQHIVDDLDYPAASIVVVAGGIAGPAETDRKVQVKIIKTEASPPKHPECQKTTPPK